MACLSSSTSGWRMPGLDCSAVTDLLARILAEIEILEMKWTALEDRVDVLEEVTCENRNRVEDLEEWQEEIDDQLDKD